MDPSKWSDEGYKAFWANAHTKLALHNEIVMALSGSQVPYGGKVTNHGDLYNQGLEIKALVGSIKPGGAVDPVALAGLIVDGLGDDLAKTVADELAKRLDG